MYFNLETQQLHIQFLNSNKDASFFFEKTQRTFVFGFIEKVEVQLQSSEEVQYIIQSWVGVQAVELHIEGLSSFSIGPV